MSAQEKEQAERRKVCAGVERQQWELTPKMFAVFAAKIDALEKNSRRLKDDEIREYLSDNSGLTKKQIEIVISKL
jgi:hypothetical protein